jgi:major membrane immunogen (membrane-anchored lipoprotein)
VKTVLILSAAMLVLAACAEREQTASGIKSDAEPYQGTNRQFMAKGWKPGDRNSWEQELKVRTVQGQNDYVKVP